MGGLAFLQQVKQPVTFGFQNLAAFQCGIGFLVIVVANLAIITSDAGVIGSAREKKSISGIKANALALCVIKKSIFVCSPIFKIN